MRKVLSETGLFPPDMLADLCAPVFDGTSAAIWLTLPLDDAAQGFCYCEPEQMADRVWNMLALGVHPAHQGRGFGKALVAALEDRLQADSQRLLIVDTSGTDAFAATRGFYESAGYSPVARIPDYWEDGDDKVTFAKHLGG